MNTTNPRDEATAAQMVAIALSDEQKAAIARAVAFIENYVWGDWYANDGPEGAPLRIYSEADLDTLKELIGDPS